MTQHDIDADGSDPSGQSPRRERAKLAAIMRYAHLAWLFAIAFVLCLWLGIVADEQLGTAPAGMLAGLILGIIGAPYIVLKELARLERRRSRDD